MSDGTLRAFGVLLALFQVTGVKTSGRRLVGIEEPEVALHPAAAGVLIDGLRDAAEHAQILVGRTALRDHLYTAGELLRIGQLDPDPESANLTPKQIELFGAEA